MKRLTGLDAGFLSMETPTSAMHVSGLAIYDPSDLPDGGAGFGIDTVRAMVRGRLHLAPPFRQRLVSVPFQLHFPIWIEDPDFDLNDHIRRVAVPAPGGMRELTELAAELNSIQLDRTRPLWEMWYIEGLEGGRVATLTKIHHAAIDGASGSEITVAIFDLTPEVVDHPVPDEAWVPDKVPSDIEMLTYATQSLVRQPLRVLKALRRTGRAALDVRSLTRRLGGGLAPLPFTAPATSINGSISSARSVAVTTLSLSDVKRVKNAFGATVNDVVLALCAGALRRYFDDRGEELSGPLLAMVPVSVRSEDARGDMGNQVSTMFTSLSTDVSDPVERLGSIHEGMRGAKEQQKAIGADTLTNWTEFAAPAVFERAMRLYARMGLADRHRPIFNLTVSNVPGPQFPLYSAGAKLEANFPLGPIFDGAALNITVMSLEDSLDFGLLTCPDVVDDVWAISDGLAVALDELLTAAEALEAAADSVGPGEVAVPAAAVEDSATPVVRKAVSDRAMATTSAGRAANGSASAVVTTPGPALRVVPNEGAPTDPTPLERAVADRAEARKAAARKVTAEKAAGGAATDASTRVAESAPAKKTSTPTAPANKAGSAVAANRSAATKAAAIAVPAKKAPAKKTAAKKGTAKKTAAPAASAKKAAATKKAPARKAPAQKAAATTNVAAEKTPAKKAAATEKVPAKKAAGSASATKKVPAKKTLASSASAKRAPAKKAPAKKVATKTVARKAEATRKTPSTTTATKRTPATKTPATKSPAKRVVAAKRPAKKAADRTSTSGPATGTPGAAGRTAAKKAATRTVAAPPASPLAEPGATTDQPG